MADLTTQVLLEFGITGNSAVTAGIDKLVASQKKLANETLEAEKVNKSFSLSLVKAKLKLSDLGKSLKDAGISSDDWSKALGGNQAKIIAVQHQLGKLEKATKADIAAKKKQKAATKKAKDQLALLELKLKEHGLTLKQAAGHTRKLTAARRGDAGAMKIVTTATNQAIRANKNHSKSVLEMLFGVRSLRNEQGKLTVSFSVLRSKLLLAAFAFGMVSRTIGKFVKSAGDAEEITNKFNTVFGQSSDEALKFARSIGQRAETELKSFLSTIQDTLVPLGFMRDTAAKLSQSTVQLALDVASFNNKMDADVIRDFQSAMVGNHETVKKYGIILNQGRVELEAFRLGLADADGNINEQSKAFARLSLIMDGSTDAHGDLARTQDELNNQLKALGATSKESMEMIGNAIKPAVILLIKFSNVALDPTAIKLYTTALTILAVRMVDFTKIVKVTRAAAAALNLTLGRTPMGLLIVGLSALAGTLAYFALKEDEATESTDNMTDSMEAQRLELVKLNAQSLEERLADQEKEWSKLDKEIIKNIDLVKEQGETQKVLIKYGKEYIELDTPNVLIAENEGLKEKANAIGAVIVGLETEIAIRDLLKQQAFDKAVAETTKAYEDQLAIAMQTTEADKAKMKEALKLGVAMKDLDPAIVQVIDSWFTYKDVVEESNEAQKNMNKLLDATVSAQKEKLEMDLFLIQAELAKQEAMSAAAGESIDTSKYTDAIAMLEEKLAKLGESTVKLTDLEKDAKSALEGTTSAQHARIIATRDLLQAELMHLLHLDATGVEVENLEELTIQYGEALEGLRKDLLNLGGVETEDKFWRIARALRHSALQFDGLGTAIGAFASSLSGLDFSALDALRDAMKLDVSEDAGIQGAKNAAELYKAQIAAREEFYGQMGEMAVNYLQQEAAKNENAIRSESKRQLDALRQTAMYKRMSDKEKAKEEKKVTDASNAKLAKQHRIQQAAAIASIWIDAYKASFKVVGGSPWTLGQPWMGIILGLAAMQTAMVASQKAPSFAKGGDFIVPPGFPNDSFPMNVESGERVQITPKSEVGEMTSSQSTVNVNFSGNVLSQDFIEDEAIPMIKEAIRRGADIGVA